MVCWFVAMKCELASSVSFVITQTEEAGRQIGREKPRGDTCLQCKKRSDSPRPLPSRTLDHYRENRALLFHVHPDKLPVAVAQLPPPSANGHPTNIGCLPSSNNDPIRTKRVTNVRLFSRRPPPPVGWLECKTAAPCGRPSHS